MTHFKTLEVVALLIDLADIGLVKGQVGTIIEVLDNHVVEVEFADKKGKTLTTLPINIKDLMLLHFETVKAT
jgi:hypothetical protein